MPRSSVDSGGDLFLPRTVLAAHGGERAKIRDTTLLLYVRTVQAESIRGWF